MGEFPTTPSWMLWSALGVTALGALLLLMVMYWLAEGHPVLQAVLTLGLMCLLAWTLERSRRALRGAESAGRHAAGEGTEINYGAWFVSHFSGAVLDQLSIEDTYADNLRLA